MFKKTGKRHGPEKLLSNTRRVFCIFIPFLPLSKNLPPIQYGCYNRERAYWSFLSLLYTLKYAIFAEQAPYQGFALDPLGALGCPQTPRPNVVLPLQVRYSYAPEICCQLFCRLFVFLVPMSQRKLFAEQDYWLSELWAELWAVGIMLRTKNVGVMGCRSYGLSE